MKSTFKQKINLLKLSTMVLAGVYLTACASYRSVDNASKQAKLPKMIQELGGSNRFNNNEEPITHWWSRLEDKPLTDLIEKSLSVNHDLRIALASVNESRAILHRSKLDYAPSLTASVGATREQLSEGVAGVQGISEYYHTGFDSSWELDLFGRIRNQVKLSNAQLSAREADLRFVQVSLASEVASVYLTLRGSQQLLTIAEHSVENQNRNLHLVERLTKVGRTSNYDLARARAQLELTAARLPSLQQDFRLSLSRLSVLTVTPVNELEALLNKQQQFPSVPPSIAVGNINDLLKRRPDVIRAESALQGAAAEYNLNVAQLYPSVKFLGSFGFMSSEWSELGKKESETFHFTPSIHWAALDLSRVKSRIKAADAKAQGRLAEFEKTVLVALQETGDAFTRFSSEELRMQSLLVAATESSNAATFARTTYEKGRGDLRDVLDAEQVRLNTAQQLVQSEMTILLNLVDIYKNLGGGWQMVSSL